MTKWQKIGWLSLAVLFAILINVTFGRYLSAKFSTLPVLNKWKIIAPQAPIVINTKEEVRVSDNGDILSATDAAKSKISVVVAVNNGQVSIAGGAVNLTGEGLFVTVPSVFAAGAQKFYVVLNDGRMAEISGKTQDPATDLIFFQAGLTGVSVASLGNSSELLPGEKLVLLINTLQNYVPKFQASFVTDPQADLTEKTFDANRPSRSFAFQNAGTAVPGTAVVSMKGDVVGIWDGNNVISSDVLKQASNLYFNNSGKINRPDYGFTYIMIGKVESSLSGVSAGAKVQSTEKNGRSGLLVGDIIVKVGGDNVTESNPLEVILQKYKLGDKINLSVKRNKQDITVPLTLAALANTTAK